MWNPSQYAQFGDERSRPFFDLVSRLPLLAPHRVVDLGCGNGSLTQTLADRWPEAKILGIDSSSEMLGGAQKHQTANLQFALADAAGWQAQDEYDVVISNAMLQWLPAACHLSLLSRWFAALAPGGWLAIQLPGNSEAPSHQLVEQLVESPIWQPCWRGEKPALPRALPIATYLDFLLTLGGRISVWETTYWHILRGPNAVLEWLKGTTLRPVLAGLKASHVELFLQQLASLLNDAYPPTEHGTVFPFRRIFFVAQRASPK